MKKFLTVLKSMLCVVLVSVCAFGATFFSACSKKTPNSNDNSAEIDAFRVEFYCEEGATIKISPSRDFKNSAVSMIGYSRDEEGNPKKDGFGEINFEMSVKQGYELDEIISTSGYDEFLTPEETGRENTYRITGVIQDLIVRIFCVSSSQPRAKLESFSSFTNESGDIEFAWKNTKNDFDGVSVEVKRGENTENFTATGNTFTYPASKVGELYNFSFTPTLGGEVAGQAYTCTRFRYPNIKDQAVVNVNIQTQNSVWPSRDLISAPSDSVGTGIRNNDYQQCLFSITNENGEEVFCSSADDYLAAKLKIRGNTSAFNEKVSYKIKLNKKADILSSLVSSRNNKSFADKEWILLKQGDNLKTAAGWAVSDIIKMGYTPAYRYVALTINGDFRGTYILCESVKQGNVDGENQSRMQVDDDGFIVELDAYWWNEDLYFKTQFEAGMMRYTFKHPDTDNINERSPEYKYIKDYINDFESSLLNLNSNHYQDFIDEESFARWLLGQDLISQNDAAGANIYMIKKDSQNSKLKMVVLWDFDCAFQADKQNQLAFINEISLFYIQSLKLRQSFLDKYVSLYNSVRDKILTGLSEKLNALTTDGMEVLNDLEFSRWEGVSTIDFKAEKDSLLNWMQKHLTWMDIYIDTLTK